MESVEAQLSGMSLGPQVSCRFPGCSRLFGSSNAMLDHRAIAHETPKPNQVQCGYPNCHKCFDTSEHLKQHQAAVHPGSPKSYWVCQVCNKGCSSKPGLDAHMVVAHSVSEVDSEEYETIASVFAKEWRKVPAGGPPVVDVLSVRTSRQAQTLHKGYAEGVRKQAGGSHQDARCLKDGNAKVRFHGSGMTCSLGVGGNTRLCLDAACGICGILRSGFRRERIKKEAFQRFGAGFYFTQTTGKANDYAWASDHGIGRHGLRAMLVCEVIAGRVYNTSQNIPQLTQPPEGYDSVQGKPGPVLNYDELVVYDKRAILPMYVVIYRV